MSKQVKSINFSAFIHSIKTTVDGGANVTFSLSGTELEALTQLLQVRQMSGVYLEIAAVPVLQKATEENGKVSKGTKRKSEWASAKK